MTVRSKGRQIIFAAALVTVWINFIGEDKEPHTTVRLRRGRDPAFAEDFKHRRVQAVWKGRNDTVEHRESRYSSPWMLPLRTNSDQRYIGKSCFGQGCRYVPGPGSTQQCCCPAAFVAPKEAGSSANKVKCFPVFSVIGAQKSGTTALFGYFLSHPNFIAPSKKECHFFDKAVLQHLQHVETNSQVQEFGRKLYQNTFVKKYIKQMPLRDEATITSYATGDATPSYVLSQQAPRFISAMLPATKLILLLRNPVDRAFSEWQMKKRRVEVQLNRDDIDAMSHIIQAIDRCQLNTSVPESRRMQSSFIMKECEHYKQLGTHGINAKVAWFVIHSSRLGRPILDCYLQNERQESEKLEAFRDCLSHGTFESVDDFEDIVLDEIDKIDNDCTSPPNGDTSGIPFSKVSFLWGTRHCWPKGSSSNIQKDFIVRGLYLEQIRMYERLFPKSSIMIIEHDDLKYRTDEIMRSVFEFVGLPKLPTNFTMQSGDDLSNAIIKQWPSFEAATGWHLESKYDKMDLRVRKMLESFYRPHNQRLAKYLGHSLGWGEGEV